MKSKIIKYNDEVIELVREDGRRERRCSHGIYHTISVPEKWRHMDAWWSHGCDGCCAGWEIEK
jgi:hypothetical protein